MSLKLTNNELILMRLSLNYLDRETQLCDNYSNLGHSDALKALKMTRRQFTGVLKHLSTKGLMWMETHQDVKDRDGCNYPEDAIIWMTEDGVNICFDNIVKVDMDTLNRLVAENPKAYTESGPRREHNWIIVSGKVYQLTEEVV